MNTRRIPQVVIVAGLLALASASYAAEGVWTKKADMPTARGGLSTCVVDGKIYAIAGARDLHIASIPSVEQYDPATDTWTKKADMPDATYWAATSVVNDKIYVIGGATDPRTSVPTVQEYDPATDTWTRKADMPTKRYWLSTSVVNGKIYAIGGVDTQISIVSTLEEYDPATDTWTKKADMPTTRCMHSTSVVNGKIYAIGGSADVIQGISTVEEYDPATDTWTRKTDMPTARKSLSTSEVNGKIYAIGGGNGPHGPPLSTVEEYDPPTDTWTKKADMPTARWCHSTSVVAGRIYAIGGDTGSLASPIPTVEEYAFSPPSPDFNGDGIVDCEDMCMLIDYWGTDESLYDIAPVPFGDGIVDVQDLILLSEHLFEEILPPELVAYWKLDETEGDIAYDSAGGNFGTISGNPIWQPDSGQVVGALQFDGLDDYISTGKVLNPKFAEFSVFAWIKGGSLGQVIISQKNSFGGVGATWLGIDPLNGCLMTELVSPPIGRFIAEPLESNHIITDDIWHHVGFVWDGSYRTLYVDGIEVAKDTDVLTSLKNSDGGLYIGTNKNRDAGTYFSGLIDDVRIYDIALIAEEVAALAQ